MAKVKITSAVFKKEGEGKFGKWYSHDIKIEGDDKVYNYLGKSNPQNKFVVGQEVEAELSQNDKGYWNIKPVQTGGFGGASSGAGWDKQKKGFAYIGAITMLAAGKITKDQISSMMKAHIEEYLN
jgi:hypothetical protein